MLSKIGIWEWLVILVVVLLVFGGSKLKGVGAALGQSIREFKKELKGDDSDKKPEEEKKEDKAE